MKRILIIAGEASADIYGAQLINKLKCLDESFRFFGVGGSRMKAAGMDVRISADTLSLFGFSEWLLRAPLVFASFKKLVNLAKTEPWDAAILIDLPDINLRLARHLKARSIPVCYYVSPQLWAWRPNRIRLIKKYVDKMLVLFPFELEFYKKHSVDAIFVGHPLVDMIERRPVIRDESKLRIAILPGSRRSEITNHVPLLSGVVSELRKRYPDAQFVVPIAETLTRDLVSKEFAKSGMVDLLFERDSQKILRESNVALIASGTATLEACLIGIPFLIFYKVSRSSKILYDLLIKVPFIGMPNLLAGNEIVKEFFQEKATPNSLTQETIRLVEERGYYSSVVTSLNSCREQLRGSFSKDAAYEFFKFVNGISHTYSIS